MSGLYAYKIVTDKNRRRWRLKRLQDEPPLIATALLGLLAITFVTVEL